MKKALLILALLLSVSVYSQDGKPHILKKIMLDKKSYVYGETVNITIRAVNTSEKEDTLIFPDLCEVYPIVNGIDYLEIFHLGCWQAVSHRRIAAGDSLEWRYEYPHESFPEKVLAPGIHSVVGYFRNNYPNTDTISIIIKELPNNVEKETAPSEFRLSQNYPNPFNPSTIIKYSIPIVETGHAPSLQVRIIVFDIIGQEIRTLVNGEHKPGNYKVEFNAEGLSSGVYFYTLKAGEFAETKKMILLR
ncbi:MAG: T9SS type A sorting domain-containing protein [Bacteroidota bacterium]